MTIKLSDELATNLLAVLGIETKMVTEVAISFKAGQAPVVEVKKIVSSEEFDEFLSSMQRYELIIREVQNG